MRPLHRLHAPVTSHSPLITFCRFSSTQAHANLSKLTCQRHRFNIPEDIHYYNCSYISPCLDTVVQANETGLSRKKQPWTMKPHMFFNETDEFRSQVGALLGCSSNLISVVPSVSYGASTVANAVEKLIQTRITAGRNSNIVILDEQFPSNVYVWRELSSKYSPQCELRTIKRENMFDGWTDYIISSIDDDTVLVSVPQVHWTDGSVVDVSRISSLLKTRSQENKCIFALDLTQSLGAMPFNELKNGNDGVIDFVMCAMYKWMLGPYGLSILYASEEMCENTDPIEYNWITRRDAQQFDLLVNYRDEFDPGAVKFDVGQRSHMLLMPMGLAAAKQINEWGVENIYEYTSEVNNRIAKEVEPYGLKISPSENRGGHLSGLRIMRDDISVHELVDKFAENNVYASIRGTSVRLAPHLWVNDKDIEVFLRVIADTAR